ncbi:hydantoinase/oxoprolinase family protein [Lacicoccus alkaliphilus]|uniref:hydantoinase/oxoprolinase family protein n=1 Tax=Lacicoccus alkaliphilus TaxID=148453 RepID=UPI0039F0B52D
MSADIGGTFTDIVLYDREKEDYNSAKVPTIKENLSKGVLDGIATMIDDFSEVEFFVHGTTAGLNAFLERKGADIALIVTKGFRDVNEIGRANRSEIYNIQYRQPEPLVKRRNIFELDERVLYDGTVHKEVSEDEVNKLIDEIEDAGYESVSIALLHSYKNPENELKVLDVLKKRNNKFSISLSHNIVREWREYERTSTTLINAYIAPIVENYLNQFEEQLEEKGTENDLFIMQSNGGVMTSEVAKDKPIQTLLSGPVGGTMGGVTLGEQTSNDNLICVDMGGTSFDVSMIINGEPDVTSEVNIEKFPILSPMVNMHTIGAGGGSIAWIEGGGLRVGPHSAGAVPGPVCYGKGGIEPTVTDANVVLGRIDPADFLGGNMKLDFEGAYKAIEELGKQLGLGVYETAEGICEIANAKMADAIRTLTISKGIDPRDFTLVAFGGAGPMHAMFIAENLGINKIIVPASAGTFSAWGMLQTDIRHDDVRTYVSLLRASDEATMKNLFNQMILNSESVLKSQNIDPNNIKHNKQYDLRYVGQEYTVTVDENPESKNFYDDLEKDFHDMHLNIYGHNNPEGAVEIVNLRVVSYGLLDKNPHRKLEENPEKISNFEKTNQVFWNNKQVDTKIYNLEKLAVNEELEGPIIIETETSTIVVPHNFVAKLDDTKNLLIEKER